MTDPNEPIGYRIPEWTNGYPRKKTKYTAELAAKSQAILAKVANSTPVAKLKPFFRVKINGNYVTLNSETRWRSRELAMEALKYRLKNNYDGNAEIDKIFPQYIKSIRPPYYTGELGRVTLGKSYGSPEFNKDLEEIMKTGQIEIVEQAEM